MAAGVPVEPLGLADDRAVPVEAEAGEVLQLGELEFGARRDAIEVLHPHQEPPRPPSAPTARRRVRCGGCRGATGPSGWGRSDR